MDNRVYYGEYSLKHWIDLILKKNIILPEYQRYFVWDEKNVETLIDTFKKKQFVPPVTIGAFKKSGTNQNLILDGQQRLTSILLAYLELYPDEATYKKTIENFANENDLEEDVDQLDNILEWNFKRLTEKGNSKDEIRDKIVAGNYKNLQLTITDHFLNNTFLGFSYLVPYITDEKVQQKYYSSVFRNINIQGKPLILQESRASLYFLDKNLISFFTPDFFKLFVLKVLANENKADFVRYVSLLSQYKKDGNTGKIARGYKSNMEKYYEEYIYSVVGEVSSSMFDEFKSIFPGGVFQDRFDRLQGAIAILDIPKQFSSIIELDVYFFGLIYMIVIENKNIDTNRKDDLKKEVNVSIEKFKGDTSHAKAPSALKYLKSRIDSSIEIYRKYGST